MKIKEFGVEIWMNAYETQCRYNLAETCVDSITIGQLLEFAGKSGTILGELLPMKMTYGAIEGSERLRDLIASLYDNQQRHNVIVTHGAIGANALVYETLVEPGDHVVSVAPTYQQHYSIPQSYGAEVSILRLREENAFLPDPDELRGMVRANTRGIALNNPNNPTGSLMDRALLEEVVEIARSVDAWLLCDEVYRGTDQHGDGFTVSIADLYEKGISTASMSKTYSLAGLRLGWIVAPQALIHAVSIHRDYNTISVGMLDDHFACIALENRRYILDRAHAITRENLALLEAWVENEPRVSWVKPRAGTTALLKIDVDMPSRAFCVKLLETKEVMFTPGSALDIEGYVRIGFANDRQVMEQGLALVSEFLREI
ncbi:aminotransferase [Pseudomonas sp. NyZ201]|uniref:aminotransferase n=1 Tax=Pseudomonas sp. NyZ201 TaxID=3409857 RepID=UPI003CE9150B